MNQSGVSRRHFFFGAVLAGAVPSGGYGSTRSLRQLGYKSPNEKLNIAAIGAGGKGHSDIMGCESENIVALCDPDAKRAERMFQKYEKAPKYTDFRRMFDKESNTIDAVLVSTPDHVHGTAAYWAIVRGKHVYCQKPLTRTVWEAQQLTDAAAKYGVATQMGNQGYSNEGARQCCEIVWNGDIGNVKEVHAWTNRPAHYWNQGPDVIPTPEPLPSTMDWQAWLAGSEYRPEYSSALAPLKWRGYPAFGCGAVGDMACHILGTPNMVLRLGAPTSVECLKKVGANQHTFPQQTILRYEFPERGGLPPVTVYWYDGLTEVPKIEGVPAGELLGDRDTNGSLFIGEKGMVTTGCYGERTRLIPVSKMETYKLPEPLLSRSPGHYRDWIRACKGGEAACSNFGVAGPFVQWMLLGVIAMNFEGKLQWDAARGRFTNNNEANEYLKPKFQKGWKFEG
jgi:predicted dehydrogenase